MLLSPHNEPGNGIDSIWVQVKDKDNGVIPVMSLAEPATDEAIEIGDEFKGYLNIASYEVNLQKGTHLCKEER
jgi:hypothetical protein